jgi:hypothetical protein
MARHRPRNPHTPKPTQPACPHCSNDEVYWRWNGSGWYACDRGQNTRHHCTKPEAVAERQQQATRLAEDRARRAREKRNGAWVKVAGIAAAITVGVAWLITSQGPKYDGPPGATAVCEDGSISYAAHHQGACSWHGGVKSWNPNP